MQGALVALILPADREAAFLVASEEGGLHGRANELPTYPCDIRHPRLRLFRSSAVAAKTAQNDADGTGRDLCQATDNPSAGGKVPCVVNDENGIAARGRRSARSRGPRRSMRERHDGRVTAQTKSPARGRRASGKPVWVESRLQAASSWTSSSDSPSASASFLARRGDLARLCSMSLRASVSVMRFTEEISRTTRSRAAS